MVQTRVKGEFYRTAIRPALSYGSECWAIKKQQEHKMDVTEMKMLRWMSEYTLKDRIRNDHIRERVGVVAPINEILSFKTDGRRASKNYRADGKGAIYKK